MRVLKVDAYMSVFVLTNSTIRMKSFMLVVGSGEIVRIQSVPRARKIRFGSDDCPCSGGGVAGSGAGGWAAVDGRAWIRDREGLQKIPPRGPQEEVVQA